jgi:hypothetical protein
MRTLYRLTPTCIRPWLMACLLLGLAAASSAAPPGALLSIVDGDAVVIDGSRALAASEGLMLSDEALVHTGPRSGLLRIEWPNGTAADLGPDTQVMIEPGGFGKRKGGPPAVYLMRGWLKLSALGKSETPGLMAPGLEVQPFKGSLVLQVSAEQTWAFAETGGAALVERDLKPATTVRLKRGEVYLRAAGTKGAISPRPTPAQIKLVPRGFRDDLPLRLSELSGKAVTPKLAELPTYLDMQNWMSAERAVRRNFVRRFSTWARQPEFRAGLALHLGLHPEWERTLFPERFVKPASAPR